MELMRIDTERAIASLFRKCEAARTVGGISARDALEGKPVPDGWRLDYQTQYYLPPNVVLL